MNLSKNKLNIIAVAALVVICTGSFIAVRSMSNGLETGTTVPSVYVASTTTTAPTTTAPTTTAAPETTTAAPATVPTSAAPSAAVSSLAGESTTLKIESIITTFPVSGNIQSTAPVSTTEPTTTEPTTTEPTTTEPTTTEPEEQAEPTTVKKPQGETTNNSGAMFEEGLGGYQYDTNGNYYYTSSDPWQRALGYTEFFDVAAGFVTIYMDTMRCKFEYGDMDWMIQFWKGQYGLVFVGHEIGVYTKPKSRPNEHYDAASNEDALYMELTGYRDGEELYHRDYGKYWWCTGFVPGTLDNLTDRSELSLTCRITMKDYKMLLAFCDSLDDNGMVLGEDYTTSGLDVLITW